MNGLDIFAFGLIVSLFINNAQARLKAESIIGGSETEPNEFPYQIVLLSEGKLACGAGIIDEEFVLTAAHCLINEKKELKHLSLVAVAGIRDLKEDSETRVEVKVTTAYYPAVYNGSSETFIGDIAVLRLADKLNLGPDSHLVKLKLPASTKNEGLTNENSYADQEAILAGYGWEKIDIKYEDKGDAGIAYAANGTFPGRLLKGKTRILSSFDCSLAIVRFIENEVLCAHMIEHEKDVHQGFCYGDSGGPLVVDGTIVGVVSHSGVNCNDVHRPGFYTRVSEYIDLIDNAKKNITSDDMRSHQY